MLRNVLTISAEFAEHDRTTQSVFRKTVRLIVYVQALDVSALLIMPTAGVVDGARVVEHASLIDEAVKTATVIASMPPMAAMVNKDMVNAAFETTLDQGLLHERRLFQILTATEDKREGMTAFVEKRAAEWKGR